MFSFPKFNFDDYSGALPPGRHMVSRCTVPLDFKLSDSGPYAFITADNAGKLHQHFVVRADVAEHLKNLEAEFGQTAQGTILQNYSERLASHMEMKPWGHESQQRNSI